MPLSARNQLPGKIESLQNGEILSHVVVRVGDHLIESVITRTSADEMKLKPGDSVRAVIKSTEVMIASRNRAITAEPRLRRLGAQ
jgi:molybdopterin-binding protein